MTTPDVVLIIGVMTTSIVSIVNAIGLYWGRRDIRKRINRANQRLMKAEDNRFHVARAISNQLDSQNQKLEKVQENTNGNISKLMDEINQIKAGMAKALVTPKPEDKDKIIVDAVTNGKS